MTGHDWLKIKHFRKTENWGDEARMDYTLVQTLDRFRELIVVPIVVTCGTQGMHAINSQHYFGKAVDIVFPDCTPDKLLNHVLNAMRFPEFMGIGVYPHWQYNGKVVGGLHLDVRHTNTRAQWLCKLVRNTQVYTDLTHVHMQSIGFLK